MSQCNSQRISCDMSDMRQNNEKMLTLKFYMDKYSSLENTTLEMLKSNRKTITYARAATYNSYQNVHVCVATQMCRKIYVKYTTKQAMTSEVLLYYSA